MQNAVRAGRQHDVDMTEGSVFCHLLYFALPLLVGNIFQQLYNTVDTWVVGNYVSNEAFSAVGTVSPIINMLIGSFTGLATGAGVVISQYYGAKNYEKVSDAVHTSVMMTIILTAAFTAIGVGMTPTMLHFMKTPADVFPESRTYLTIYFSGMAGLLFYNMGAGILRAVGDSRRPFYYLVVAAIINTVLDLVFVIKFNMGVAGVAYATIIAQAISAALTFATLMMTDSCVKVMLRKLRLNITLLLKIIRVGIPAAFQMALTAFSNVFVQSYINQFGADCMGGWTAYLKLDQLIFMPIQSLSLSVTTFVGQNLGIGNAERAKHGMKTALLMSVTVTLVVSSVVIFFAPFLVAFFNDKETVIEYGTLFLRTLTPFYVMCSFNHIHAGTLRGAGDSKAPMIIMLCSFVFFRQIYLFVMSNFIANEILPLAMGYPAGWIVCSILMAVYYHHTDLGASRLVADSEVQADKQA